MTDRYDVVIIGGGVGGLSAALVLSRARRRVAVIDSGKPRNAPAGHVHGYLGREGTPPSELRALGRVEVASYGATLIDTSVRNVRRDDPTTVGPDPFEVTLDDGRVLRSRRLLVATGLTDRLPDIPGVAERWAKDVLHCPYCHGYEVADQPVGVVNGTPSALHQVATVHNWSHDVVLFTNGTEPPDELLTTTEALHIPVVTTPIERLAIADDRLAGVELTDGTSVPRRAVFVAPAFVPNDGLLRSLGAATQPHPMGEFVTSDEGGRTSVPGVWAVGDVTTPRMQLITAAGDGSRAAIDINTDLVIEDVARFTESRRTEETTAAGT